MDDTGFSFAPFSPAPQMVVGVPYTLLAQPDDNTGAVVFTVPLIPNPSDPTLPE